MKLNQITDSKSNVMLPPLDPAFLMALEIADEQFGYGQKVPRQTTALAAPGSEVPLFRIAVEERPISGLTITERARTVFGLEWEGRLLQIESRDKGRLLGWLDQQPFLEGAKHGFGSWTILVEEVEVQCTFRVGPGVLITPSSSWTLSVDDQVLLAGPMNIAKSSPRRRLLEHLDQECWQKLTPSTRLGVFSLALRELLRVTFQSRAYTSD